jgi:hypothetical protein
MNETTQQIDAVLDALWASVVAQQDAYRSTHGSYYQMLWTHSEPPSGMASPDALAVRPTDQPGEPIAGFPTQTRSRMRIDTYGTPAGWVMTLEASINGTLWSRAIDCGVDESRSYGWTLQESPV